MGRPEAWELKLLMVESYIIFCLFISLIFPIVYDTEYGCSFGNNKIYIACSLYISILLFREIVSSNSKNLMYLYHHLVKFLKK